MSRCARSILICDDNIDHLMLMKREIEGFSSDFRVTTVTSAKACLDELTRNAHDVTVIDYLLRDANGLDLLREVVTHHPQTIPVMITGMGNEDVAVQAMKSGAGDYIIKSTGSFAVVPLVVARAIERRALVESKRDLESRAGHADRLGRLGAVALGVAHDVNQLLGIVLGRLQIAQSLADFSVARPHLAVAEKATRDAAAIVDRVLSSGEGQARPAAESVLLAEVVEDALEFTRDRWERNVQRHGFEHRLVCEVPADLRVPAPATALREVLTNLIVNAVEAMPEGGTLTIRATTKQDQVHLVVQDTGGGMSREALARVGQLFQTDGKNEGHGLGLHTCQQIMSALGGRLMIESELEVGTTCELILPLGVVEAPPAQSVEAAVMPGRRVLVVDNEPRVASLMEDILTADSHRVVVAYSGEEAMSKFQRDAYDLMVCDVSMPGMSGLEVARAARTIDRHLAVALISGWGNEPTLQACDHEVVDFVMPKPLDIDKIRRLVAEGAELTAFRRSGPAASASTAS